MSETNTSEFGVCEPAANDQGVCEPAANDHPHSNDISGLADINEQYESSSIMVEDIWVFVWVHIGQAVIT